ncbi:MAG TPA: nucleotidyltransferase family protein [Syntrophorhabdales bacterium]|nr:nucleotidyltransferase family protein [Syntrophorhabdales bacterium]
MSEIRRTGRIDTVILAAGSSRRLGVNKLFLTVDGEPVLKRTLRPFLDMDLGTVFVVTGFQRERIEHLLRDVPVRLVHNSDFEEGMSASVRAVLPFLEPGRPLLLHLGDKPFVKPETLRRILDSFSQGTHRIVLPVYKGQKGHPVLIDVTSYLDETRSLKGETALKPIIEKHAQDILYVEGDEGILLDLDTEDDIDLLRNRGYTIEKG